MTRQKWIVTFSVGTLILALLALGFAAMSTNPPFTVPTWLPSMFFVLAGFLAGALVIYLMWEQIKRVRFQKPMILTSGKSEATLKAQPVTNSSWLEQVLEYDRGNLGKRIHQYRENWIFNNIHETEPSMAITIQIVNASVFPIVIKGIEGSFQIQGTPCNWDATTSGSRIPRGESGNIYISQRLLKETVDKMVQLNNERGGFMVDLNACLLVIQAEEPNTENESVKVRLRLREQARF